MACRSRVRLLLLLALLTGASGCSSWLPDLVEQQRFQAVSPITRVAVVPFYPTARLSREAAESQASAWEAAALVTRFVTEALAQRSLQVVPPDDVQLGFEGQGLVTPRQAPEAAALLAASQFGADAILLGEVRRYRERQGSSYGSLSPASVEFQVTLYSAPDATKLWVARFDQTQTSLTSNLFDTARYPGGGSRWLTVAELAQWGAQLVAEKLPLGR